MSWEHAMSVAKMLDGLINEYERQVPSLGAMRVKLAQAQEAARVSAQEQA